jgi:hypothetical protein
MSEPVEELPPGENPGWYMPTYEAKAARKQSVFGLISTLMGVLLWVGAVGLIVTVGVLSSGGPMAPESPVTLLVGVLVIGGGIAAALGAALAIAGFLGFFMPGRRHVLDVVGLLLNALLVLGMVGVVILGLVAG